MGLFDGLFKAFSRDEAAVASRTARAAEAAKAAERVKGVGKAAEAAKPAPLTTRPKTNVALEPAGSPFKKAATEIATSRTVKTTAKVAGGATIVGGGVYVLGKLSGNGLNDLGYGIRGLTNNYTPQDVAKQNLDNQARAQDQAEKRLDFLNKYLDFLNANQLYDSPSSRDAFDRYVMGSGAAPPNDSKGSGISPVGAGAIGVAAALGIVGVILLAQNKKKGAKR